MQSHAPVDQVIVIGASRGGLSALQELLGYLPSDLNAAVFITMHIGAHDSLLPTILAKTTSLNVSFAQPQEKIRNGHVYVAPPDQHLLVERGSTRIVRSAKENHTRPAIDPMFRSAAVSYRNRTIGVILTGELDDGVVGLQAVKAYGGMTLVQDPETAEAPSMPASALRHVDVDACMALPRLAELLVQTVQQRPLVNVSSSEPMRIEPFATENDMTYDLSSGGAHTLSKIGEVSGVSCPECGGALWELGRSPLRFRCHTGHSYTSAALFEGQNEAIEEALWVAIRALHEKQLLLGKLAQRSTDVGAGQAAEEYNLISVGLESHKTALRALLANLRPI